jgi:hypothetical protein
MLALLLLAAGCAAALPVTYHALSALPPPTAGATARPSRTLALGPVALPEVIDRSQIVLRTAENRLLLSESHRWAGSLRDAIARVLTENLSILLAGDVAVLSAEELQAESDLQLTLSITRLEAQHGAGLWLVASWTLRAAATGKTSVWPACRLHEPLPDASHDAIVAAHSRILAALSRELAGAVRLAGSP